MPKYACPTCHATFDDLFDVSICLGNHNMARDDAETHADAVATIARPQPRIEHNPRHVKHKINFVSLPSGVADRFDLQTLALYRDKICAEFFVDMPWKLPLKWSRRNSTTLGRITWSIAPFGDAVLVECQEDAAPDSNKVMKWRRKAFTQISLMPGRPWKETLCTLVHELLHAYDYYLHGFWSKSWSESHLGYFDRRKNSINVEFKAMGSEINIAVKGGDRQMDGETETWLRDNLEKGSHVYWEWNGKNNTVVKGHGIVKRRNSHMVSIDAYGVFPSSYRHVDKIPWQKIKQIDGFDVVDWMNGDAPTE
jgi:hypothetical protein